MSGLNSQYVTGVELEDYFVSGETALALANGTLWFYVDNNRTQPKNVFTIVQGSGNPPNYTYQPLPNPIRLSGSGTIMDANNNNVALYYYPFDQFGNQQLYYVECYDSQGNLQFTREAWPFPNVGGGGGGGGAGTNVVGITNQLTNPQFADVLFNPNTGLTIMYSGSGTTTVNVAPGWALNITYVNTGALTVTQSAITGSSAYPNNPPFTLNLSGGSNITKLTLVQQLNNNPDWAAPQIAGTMGYLSGSILLGPNTSVQLQYVASNGNTTPQTIVSGTNASGQYATSTGTIQLLPASSAQNGDTGYDQIIINILNLNSSSSISNVQVAPLTNNVTGVQYDQTPVNRQYDYMFHYYNPLLQYKPIASWLIGWDFPLNPAQQGASVAAQATGANTSYYAWDQTILFQTVTSGITVSRDAGSGAFNTLAAPSGGTQLALVQYLGRLEAREMLTSRKCVNISANASVATTATVSLWYTKTTLPSIVSGTNKSIVATLDANGYPATLNSTWVQVPRSGLSNAQVTTSATNAAQFTIGTSSNAEFNQYQLAGWDMQGNADIANATSFAIVVGTANLAQNAYINWQSISCQDGDVATIPATLGRDIVLHQCRKYWEQSYNIGVVPGTSTIEGSKRFDNYTQISGGSTLGYISPLDLEYLVTKRIDTPIITIYEPSSGTVNEVLVELYKNGPASAASTTISFSANWMGQTSSNDRAFWTASTATTSPLSVADATPGINAFTTYHYTADARYGIV